MLENSSRRVIRGGRRVEVWGLAMEWTRAFRARMGERESGPTGSRESQSA